MFILVVFDLFADRLRICQQFASRLKNIVETAVRPVLYVSVSVDADFLTLVHEVEAS